MYFRSDDSSTPRIIFLRRGKPLGYYYFATINNEVNTDALAKDPSQWKGECIQVSQLNASPTERQSVVKSNVWTLLTKPSPPSPSQNIKFQLASRKTFSSTRTFQPAALSLWQDQGSNQSSAFAAIVVAGGIFLGAGNVASCEVQRQKTEIKDPVALPVPTSVQQSENESELSESNYIPKDPMTPYARFAAKREIEEEQQSHVQATSPAAKAGDAIPSKYISDMTVEELRIEEATRKAKQHSGGIKVFSGNGNMALSLEIARHLGINLGKATVGRFADGEANVVIHENVRGKDCYVIQPTCPPVNDNIMELLLMVSTLRRASARRITVVIPYYGYARQDRKMQVK